MKRGGRLSGGSDNTLWRVCLVGLMRLYKGCGKVVLRISGGLLKDM